MMTRTKSKNFKSSFRDVVSVRGKPAPITRSPLALFSELLSPHGFLDDVVDIVSKNKSISNKLQQGQRRKCKCYEKNTHE
jgi:hypothetical protein